MRWSEFKRMVDNYLDDQKVLDPEIFIIETCVLPTHLNIWMEDKDLLFIEKDFS